MWRRIRTWSSVRVVTEREQRMRALVADVVEPVRRYLLRRTDAATADDVLGDTLLVLWRRLDDVPADALPWTIVVARNGLANHERATRRQGRVVGKIIALDPPPLAADGADPADPAARTDAAEAEADGVRRALSRLRADDAEVLRLWAWDELASPQIALVLGISPNAAALRLHRAKKRLRAELLTSSGRDGHVEGEGGERHD